MVEISIIGSRNQEIRFDHTLMIEDGDAAQGQKIIARIC